MILVKNAPVLAGISLEYERNKDIPEADLYQKIEKEIINKKINKFIRFSCFIIFSKSFFSLFAAFSSFPLANALRFLILFSLP